MTSELPGRELQYTAVPAVYMRGGTSKGVFLHARDVPPAGPERDALLLRIMGSPDALQIDGMGGTYSSTSKVVIVEPVSDNSVAYWFAQVGVDRPLVDWSGNCGNLTTAVAAFAIDEGLVAAGGATDGATVLLRLINGNTGIVVEAEARTTGGRAATTGDLVIAGVPGSGSPVVTRYLEPAGGVLGKLLPTGSARDVVETADGPVEVSIVDAAHPYAFVAAETLGLAGDRRTPAELNADAGLLARVEAVRAACAVLVGAASSAETATDSAAAIPRIILVQPDDLVQPGSDGADLRVTAFSMGAVHRALPMTGALCTGAAAGIAGTIASGFGSVHAGTLRLRHPKGITEVLVETRPGADPIRSLGIVRTARRLMDGVVYPREY